MKTQVEHRETIIETTGVAVLLGNPAKMCAPGWAFYTDQSTEYQRKNLLVLQVRNEMPDGFDGGRTLASRVSTGPLRRLELSFGPMVQLSFVFAVPSVQRVSGTMFFV